MAFIRTKTSGGHQYFQLVENYRKNRKLKQRLLYYMGKNLVIPRQVLRKYRISKENVNRLKQKYPSVRIVDDGDV